MKFLVINISFYVENVFGWKYWKKYRCQKQISQVFMARIIPQTHLAHGMEYYKNADICI